MFKDFVQLLMPFFILYSLPWRYYRTLVDEMSSVMLMWPMFKISSLYRLIDTRCYIAVFASPEQMKKQQWHYEYTPRCWKLIHRKCQLIFQGGQGKVGFLLNWKYHNEGFFFSHCTGSASHSLTPPYFSFSSREDDSPSTSVRNKRFKWRCQQREDG